MNADYGVHVSVIIPYHREHPSVYDSVKSALLQTYPPYELILVSDGCATDLDLKKLPETSIKIKIIRLKSNLGPAKARNAGMNKAKGNFIAFLDSDDYWGPDKLLNQVSILCHQVDRSSIILVSPVIIVVDKKQSHVRSPLLEDSKAGRRRLFKAPYLYLGSTALFSMDLLKRIGLQNTNLRIYEDFEWQLRIACNNGITFLSSNLPDVFVNKSFKRFSEGTLGDNYKELVSSVVKNPNFPRRYLKYLSSVYFIDVSRNYFRRGKYIRFIAYLVASFWKCPRVTLHNEKLWDISDKNGISRFR